MKIRWWEVPRLLLGVLFGGALVGLWGATAARALPEGLLPERVEIGLALVSVVLPHLFLIGAGGCLLLCLAGRRWRRGLGLLALAGFLSAMWLRGAAWLARPDGLDDSEGAGPVLEVMTWNVARLGEFCGRADCAEEEAAAMRCVGEVLRAEAPDVLALQEISLRRLEALEADLSWECRLETDSRQAAWIDYAGRGVARHGGLAVCVPAAGGWRLQSFQRPSLPPEWHYVFTEVRHADTGALFNLLSVHFKPSRLDEEETRRLLRGEGEGWRAAARAFGEASLEQERQASRLLENTARLQDPTVLAGDFNSTRDAQVHAGLRQQFTDTWERGGWGEGATRSFVGIPLRIDFIYASTPHFAVLEARRADAAGCSDHRPVTTALQLRPRP